MGKDSQKLQQIIDLGVEIAQVQDIDALLEKILRGARRLVNADAGTIYIKNDHSLKFSHAQNGTLQKRLPPGRKLIYETFSVPLDHHSISGYVASTGEMLNISDVYQLNGEVPYTFNPSYDQTTHYRTQSMLTIPLVNSEEQVIGVMQLINAQNGKNEVVSFSISDVPLVRIFAGNVVMAIERAQTRRSEILGMISFLKELSDPEETEAHVNRVGAYSAEIYEVWASKKGLPRAKIETNAEILRMAAMLHDIGKLAIPQNIREKPEKFTAQEYEIMKQHTVKGSRMLLASAQIEYERVAAKIALNHHEYWSGKGYPGHIDLETGRAIPGYENGQGKPRGKKGDEIPIFGRIVAVADVYDALSCRRVFRAAMKEDAVLNTLKKGAGNHFDPDVIDAFFARIDMIYAIARRFPEED